MFSNTNSINFYELKTRGEIKKQVEKVEKNFKKYTERKREKQHLLLPTIITVESLSLSLISLKMSLLT